MFISKIRQAFFQYGWQMPVLVPPAFLLGRGVGNSILGIFVLWALFSFRYKDFKSVNPIFYTWTLMIAAFGLSLISASDTAKAGEDVLQFAAHSAVFFIVLAAIGRSGGNFRTLTTRMGYAAIAVFVISYAQFFMRGFSTGWDLTNKIHTAWLAYLLPFVIVYFTSIKSKQIRYLLVSAVSIATIFLFIIVNSRTEVVIVMFTLTALWFFRTSMKWLPIIVFFLFLPLVISMHNVSPDILEKFNNGGSLYTVANEISSMRLEIWGTALSNPPDNQITGVGMGHAQYSIAANKHGVQHLHNFIIDVWYETGILGVCMLLLWLGAILRFVIPGYGELSKSSMYTAFPWMACAASIFFAAMLDRHYQVVDFAFFLPFCLAVTYHYISVKNNSQDTA